MSAYPLGSLERPLLVAVVGSGPSAFYAAEALLREKGLSASVDMIERLPTPYGLVRGGVAPDHQKIKSVIVVYEKVAQNPAFRFFGNVKLGADVSVADLRRHYDAIVYAVGNESDKRMGIPGEDLQGSHPATEFVGWYNSHPDHRAREFDLSCARAAVVGVGNVAMDVTRILVSEPGELAKTDIAGYALEALRRSRVREVVLLGRRGPAEAAFSPAEIQEIGGLKTVHLDVDPAELELEEASAAALKAKPDPDADKNLAYLRAQAKAKPAGQRNAVRLRFRASPVEVLGLDGKVIGLRLEKNRLVPDGKGGVKAEGTGQFETLEVGLVLRSVGYYGVPIPEVPFDPKLGRIPNKDGRALDAAGTAVPGEYVVGWAKRGPTGLIGTNRADSVATVTAMLADIKGRVEEASQERTPAAAAAMLSRRKPDLVRFEDWKKLDALELENGRRLGKVREKFSNLTDMLSALGKVSKES